LSRSASRPERAGDVVGDVLGAKRDRAQPDQHPAGMQRDVGDFGPQLNQSHAQFALLLGQAGERGGDRRGDDRLDAEMRRADHIIDVAQGRGIRGDDVDIDPEAVGVEADRVLDALDPVDRVQCRLGVENDLAAAVERIAAAGQQFVDVGLLDLVAAELNLDVGDVADQPAGAITRPHFVDGDAGHALGQFDCLADREFARFHVGNIAALDPAALALACAEHA
jgi:hypothetical protein